MWRFFARPSTGEISRSALDEKTPFNDLDRDSLLRIAFFLPERKDLVALRSVCRATHAASSAASWRYLVAAHSGVTVAPPQGADRRKELQHAMAAYRWCMNPRVGAESIGGAWTDDARYYSRQAMPGAVSGKVLLLKDVWWLELDAHFQDVFPGEYLLFLRHSNEGWKFPLKVTEGGATLKELQITRTDSTNEDTLVTGRPWSLGSPSTWNRQLGMCSSGTNWQLLELGKVVVIKTPRTCHVKLFEGNCSKRHWALDYLELRRVLP
jgi:hypothetical protein